MKTKGSRALRIHVLSVWVLGLALGGCATATDTARLDAVARAGAAYADELPRLLDQAFEVAAAVDSQTLAAARDGLSLEQRRERLREFDMVMRERLKEYRAAKRHSDLLKSYFLALRSLLDPDGVKGAGDAAKRLTAAFGKLSPRLRQARLGGVSVSGLVEPAARITVASFRSRAVQRELEARGPAIERELAVQEALVTALVRQVQADREVLSGRFRHREVVEPYAYAARLPRTWPARRLRSLRGVGDVEAAEAAEKAVRSLRAAYVAALEGRLDHTRAAELAATVEGFVELVSRLGAGAGRAVR